MQPSNGIQIHIEILEFELMYTDDLIDRFAVDVTGSTTSATKTLSGVVGLAEIELSLRLQCTSNFYGPNCEQSLSAVD